MEHQRQIEHSTGSRTTESEDLANIGSTTVASTTPETPQSTPRFMTACLHLLAYVLAIFFVCGVILGYHLMAWIFDTSTICTYVLPSLWQ